jgi:inorganic pyrophosphatase
LAIIRRFFQDYKQLEGKEVAVDEILPPSKAYPIIKNALATYKKQFPPQKVNKPKR